MVSMSRIALFTAVLANSAAAFRPAATRAARRGLTVAAYDIQGTVASADVVVFSKSWCPFCDKTKRVFRNLEVDATIVELDQLDEGEAIQADLAEMTGQRTVPSVFIKGTHIGGNDDTQQAARSGRLAELLGTTGATAGQLHAVETGKMITETEANVRKTVGVGVGLATAAIYATSGLPYATLSAGIFLSISTYRTGAEYQWGCIVGSRWNVDGVLSMSEIPAGFADFVKAKQLQLLTNVLSSAAAGVVLANVAALFAGDASLAVLGETVQAAVPLIAITAIASVGAGAIGAVRQ